MMMIMVIIIIIIIAYIIYTTVSFLTVRFGYIYWQFLSDEAKNVCVNYSIA